MTLPFTCQDKDCDRLADAYAVFACKHDHITDGYLCASHLIDKRISGDGLCTLCWLGEHAHDCHVVLRAYQPQERV